MKQAVMNTRLTKIRTKKNMKKVRPYTMSQKTVYYLIGYIYTFLDNHLQPDGPDGPTDGHIR